jgi:hypothetical protein
MRSSRPAIAWWVSAETGRESPGANAERLASTPRQYRPIADPVLHGARLGNLERPAAREPWDVDSRARVTIESKDDIRMRKLPSPDGADTAAMLFSGRAQTTLSHWPSEVQQMIAEDDLITRILLPAAPAAPQCSANRPLDATWFSAGSGSSASSTASSSAGDPNGHLDLAPDRRLADLELSGADRAAVAKRAEGGQQPERVSL